MNSCRGTDLHCTNSRRRPLSSTARPLNRVPQLDGIRGFAVAAVVFVHLSPMLEFSAGKSLLNIALYHIFHVGWLGVDIFFVLSGFLITGIILKSRHKPNFWTVFYARRGFRILPAFLRSWPQPCSSLISLPLKPKSLPALSWPPCSSWQTGPSSLPPNRRF